VVLFSLEWLRQLCPVASDADRVVAALTGRGLTVDSIDARGSDRVLDVDVPANRPDCLGHLGIARELSAAFGVRLAPALEPPEAVGPAVSETVSVEIESPDLCPRYTAGLVRDVRVAPSPEWVVRRLEACGLRSVSNVVDASNLVMLELGQPVHFFDVERLARGAGDRCRIGVRPARPGERLRTLDGVDRALEPDMLLITDGERATALAGVIGGADSEIDTTTRHVLIEAAHFAAPSVRATARRLGVQTDASYRFERGVDPAAPPAAQALAARLLHDLAGGNVAPDPIDVYPRPPAPRTLRLHVSELERLLGFEPSREEIGQALEALRLSPEFEGDRAVRTTPPTWRTDLRHEADLVEEVARHVGYDRIPAPVDAAVDVLDARAEPWHLEEQARDVLTHAGFHEAIGYAMVGRGEDDRFVEVGSSPALELSNPIAEPLALLRRSVLPGLLRAVDRNLRRGNGTVRLFEIGSVFLRDSGSAAPTEPAHLGIAWCGSGEPPHWSRPDRPVDLHDVIGLVEHVLDELRPGYPWNRSAGGTPPAFHPARSLHWRSSSGSPVAWGGALHPELQRELDREVYLLEVILDRLAELEPRPLLQRPVPRFPAVTRDLSLLLTGDVPYATLVETLAGVPSPAPARFEALDRYEGPPLAGGQTSLTVRITLQPTDRTLTDEEVETYRRALVQTVGDALEIRIRS
jgi:phenylalanyl-tRNA synthetase beta chain